MHLPLLRAQTIVAGTTSGYTRQTLRPSALWWYPEQRCWVEREQVGQEQSNANIPAAIAGAIIGGILGHQVGGGSGQDIATVGALSREPR